MGTILCPGKADSVLIVDPDAVLSFAVSPQGFQSIAGRDQKTGQGARAVQGKQAPPRG
jgi:hypothetical protein